MIPFWQGSDFRGGGFRENRSVLASCLVRTERFLRVFRKGRSVFIRVSQGPSPYLISLETNEESATTEDEWPEESPAESTSSAPSEVEPNAESSTA